MSGVRRCSHRVLLVSRLKDGDLEPIQKFLQDRQTGKTLTDRESRFYKLSFQCVHIQGHHGTHRDTLSYEWGTPEEYDEERKAASRTSDRAGLLQSEMATESPSGHATWLFATMQHLDTLEVLYTAYEDGKDQHAATTQHFARVERLKAEAEQKVKQHNADLAARRAQQTEGQEIAAPRDRA